MFFLLRSAACIGAVVCMLPDAGGGAALQTLALDGGRAAVATAARYCGMDPDCLRSGTSLAAAALVTDVGGVPRLRPDAEPGARVLKPGRPRPQPSH